MRQLYHELKKFYILESEYELDQLVSIEPSEDNRILYGERKAIVKALESTGENRSRAAELLGMSRRAFYNKLAKYELL